MKKLIEKKIYEFNDLTIKSYHIGKIIFFKKIINRFENRREYRLFNIPLFNNVKSHRNTIHEYQSEENEIHTHDYKVSILVDITINTTSIADTIRSILLQTYSNLEIILYGKVHYNITDALIEKKDPLAQKINWNFADSIESAIKKASGDYIAFCACGDTFEREHIQRKIDIAKKHHSRIIVSDAKLFGSNKARTYIENTISDRKKFLSHGTNKLADEDWRNRNFIISMSCWMFERTILESCNFSCLSHPNLLDWWIGRQTSLRNVIYYTPEILTNILLSKDTSEKNNIHTLYKKFQTLKGDYFLGTRKKKPLSFPQKSAPIFFSRDIEAGNIKKRRMAIFASFSQNASIDDHVIFYLNELKKWVDGIVFVADNPLLPDQLNKIRNIVICAQCKRHEEYDWGSYKRGFQYLQENNLLSESDELIICNDSCFGPIFPFSDLFSEMNSREKKTDFWGISMGYAIKPHIQSYFFCIKRNVFLNPCFSQFMQSVTAQEDVLGVLLNYEFEFTEYLEKHGFKYDTYFNSSLVGNNINMNDFLDLKIPLVKVKIFNNTYLIKDNNIKQFLSKMSIVNKNLSAIVENYYNKFNKTK